MRSGTAEVSQNVTSVPPVLASGWELMYSYQFFVGNIGPPVVSGVYTVCFVRDKNNGPSQFSHFSHTRNTSWQSRQR